MVPLGQGPISRKFVIVCSVTMPTPQKHMELGLLRGNHVNHQHVHLPWNSSISTEVDCQSLFHFTTAVAAMAIVVPAASIRRSPAVHLPRPT